MPTLLQAAAARFAPSPPLPCSTTSRIRGHSSPAAPRAARHRQEYGCWNRPLSADHARAELFRYHLSRASRVLFAGPDRSARASTRAAVFDVDLNPINGGSFQVWVCHEGAGYPNRQRPHRRDCRARAETRLDVGGNVREFSVAGLFDGPSAARLDPNGGIARQEDLRLRRLHERQCVASALPPRCTPDPRLRRQNPIKWRRRTPGTNIPIVSEDAAREDADYFLVLPWSFEDQVSLARETAFRARRRKVHLPAPRDRSVLRRRDFLPRQRKGNRG